MGGGGLTISLTDVNNSVERRVLASVSRSGNVTGDPLLHFRFDNSSSLLSLIVRVETDHRSGVDSDGSTKRGTLSLSSSTKTTSG